jgi:putative restriction endonuclease
MTEQETDYQVRIAAFTFLREQKQLHGEILDRSTLTQGFLHRDQRIPLIGPQGIFKPALLDLPLSITTAPLVLGSPRPYNDELGSDGRLKYRYRGTDAGHRDNAGLRRLMQIQTPLVYFHGVRPGKYLPAFPAYIVGDEPAMLTFTVEVDDPAALALGRPAHAEAAVDDRRRYTTVTAFQRLHQRAFRERVLHAYRESCAICHLRHQELLEAAHILPDGHPEGQPIVPNGIALCTLHHAAFDQNIIGIRPDLVVEVRTDVLEEIDGPMLKHGLQGFHGAPLIVPHARDLRPNPRFLEERYTVFRAA